MKRTKTLQAKEKPVRLKVLEPSKDGEPRYTTGQHPEYDSTYRNQLERSRILNADARSRDITRSGIMVDEPATKRTLVGIVGSDKPGHEGTVYNPQSGQWVPALMPLAQIELKEIWKEWVQWRKDQVTFGYSIELPTEWPKHLMTKRLRAEALVDVKQKEIIALNTALAKYQARQEKERIDGVLRFGPELRGWSDGALQKYQLGIADLVVDGQKVKFTNSGVPFIDEPSSPYNGMAIADYRKVAGIWRKKVVQMADDIKARKKAEKEASGSKSAIPMIMKSPRGFFRTRKPDPADFPSWPEGAKKIQTDD